MALVRWEPARELSDMSRLFDAFFGEGNGARTRRWTPAMDLVESEGSLILKADLPGLDREDVAIEIRDNVLTISGERKEESTENVDGFYRFERSFGSFSRSMTLPEGIDAQAVRASFDKGVLEVRIPKPEDRKPHRVEIAASSIDAQGEEKKN